MKRVVRISSLLALSLALTGVVHARQSDLSSPVITATDATTLGQAYSLMSGKTLNFKSCITFEGEPKSSRKRTGMSFRFRRDQSLRDAVTSGHLSLDASISSLFATGRAEFVSSFVNKTLSNQDLVTLDLIIDYESDFVNKVAMDGGDEAYSLSRCGTHYVSSISYGASLSYRGFIARDKSTSIKSESGSVEGSGSGGSGKVSAGEFAKLMFSTDVTEFKMTSRGIDGFKTLNNNDSAALLEQFNKFLDGSAKESPRPLTATLDLYPTANNATGDRINNLIAAVTDYARVRRASDDWSNYADGALSGATTVFAGPLAIKKQEINELKTLTSNKSPTELATIPEPGWKDSIYTDRASKQAECETDNQSPKLVVVSGTWSNSGIRYGLCENVNMQCVTTGKVRRVDVSPEEIKFIVGAEGHFHILLGEGVVAAHGKSLRPNLSVSCRPYFLEENRQKAMADAEKK